MNDFKTWWAKRNFYGKYAAQQAWDASRKATLDEVRMLIIKMQPQFPIVSPGKLLQAIDELEGER